MKGDTTMKYEDFTRIQSMANPVKIINQITEKLCEVIGYECIVFKNEYFFIGFPISDENQNYIRILKIEYNKVILQITDGIPYMSMPLYYLSDAVLSNLLVKYIDECEKQLDKKDFDKVFGFLNLQKEEDEMFV